MVVRTFQLEDGVLREREQGREGDIDGWKRISELDIGDAERAERSLRWRMERFSGAIRLVGGATDMD